MSDSKLIRVPPWVSVGIERRKYSGLQNIEVLWAFHHGLVF
jgi:hypothetical protein